MFPKNNVSKDERKSPSSQSWENINIDGFIGKMTNDFFKSTIYVNK
jgi:hypothetical protein